MKEELAGCTAPLNKENSGLGLYNYVFWKINAGIVFVI
jgi:hypothetical protein